MTAPAGAGGWLRRQARNEADRVLLEETAAELDAEADKIETEEN